MKKPWRYHGECCASGGPAAKTLGAGGPLGFGLGTSLDTTFTMVPPRLFQIMSQGIPQIHSALNIQCPNIKSPTLPGQVCEVPVPDHHILACQSKQLLVMGHNHLKCSACSVQRSLNTVYCVLGTVYSV